MPINIALLGSGIFAQTAYLPALAKSSEINLHTVWSRSQKSVDSLAGEAQKLGISSISQVVYGQENLDKVLDDSAIDAVIVVLPITKQPDIVLRALGKGKHVLSEKPLHASASEAAVLIGKYEKEFKPKGLIWRVAENFEHETIIRYAAQAVRRKELGPVLYWQLIKQGTTIDGSKYQATEWRTIPDYQGGFLMDGGVHDIAMLRTVIPTLPAKIISSASLHRKHLLPHDTVQAIALPPSAAATEPHGPKTALTTAVHSEQSIPGPPVGQSAPTGTIVMSFADPDLNGQATRLNGLYISCLHGRVELLNANGEWTCNVFGAKESGVKDESKSGKADGVPNECNFFARAVASRKAGQDINQEEDLGNPRGPMWDVSVIEAMLTSNGKEVDLEQLNQV